MARQLAPTTGCGPALGADGGQQRDHRWAARLECFAAKPKEFPSNALSVRYFATPNKFQLLLSHPRRRMG